MCLSFLLGAGAVLTGCSKKPDEAQCIEFADHLIEMMQSSRDKPSSRVKKLAQDKHQDIVTACVRDGTLAEVECVMGQTELSELAKNCK